MNSLKAEFTRIARGAPTTFRNLTVFTLERPEPGLAAPSYLLAEDAIGQGLARITEVGEGGSVPELRFENNSTQPVLLLDGEELIGAKQNRVLNLTILAPPQKVTIIPVSCVEAGRWHMESATFSPASHVMYARGRAARTSQVTRSMRTAGTRRSDQSAVWNDIAMKASRMGADSPTQAMAAVYDRYAIDVEGYVRAFQCTPQQAGVVFAIDGRVVGLDLFDHPQTLRRLFPKLVRSYALDAMETASAGVPHPSDAAAIDGILDEVAAAPSFAQPAVGIGKDVRFSGTSIAGSALWAEDRYVHVCAFCSDQVGPGGTFQTRISRPTRRRRE